MLRVEITIIKKQTEYPTKNWVEWEFKVHKWVEKDLKYRISVNIRRKEKELECPFYASFCHFLVFEIESECIAHKMDKKIAKNGQRKDIFIRLIFTEIQYFKYAQKMPIFELIRNGQK